MTYKRYNMQHKYGWKRDHADGRDFKFKRAEAPIVLPSSVDLRPKMPSVWDQLQLGSCTAHGILACDVFCEMLQNVGEIMLSRLFLYNNELDLEGTTSTDSGGEIRDGIKTLNSLGACIETLWPYDTTQYAVKPPPVAYADALNHESVSYARIDDGDLQGLKTCLFQGFPATFGFQVFQQMESDQCAKDGLVQFPSHWDILSGSVGGHCVAAVGYDDSIQIPTGKAGWFSKQKYTTGALLCRNSWGASWGIAGYFWLPYDYITSSNQLSNDFWTIRKVSQ